MASTKIRGITIEIGADTNPLVQAFKSANSSIYSTQKSLKDVEKLLKVDPSNVTLLAQKQEYLNTIIAQTRQSLKLQEEMLKEMPTDSTGQLSEEQKALARNIEDTKNRLANYEGQLTDVNDEIMGTAKSTDNLGKETKEAGKEAQNASSGGWTAFRQMMADLGTSVIKSAVSGIQQLGTALVSAGKQAIASYGDYEQLVGGVETLFGDYADSVIENAQRAYETAGLSANEYMETVTSFSASLLQSAKSEEQAVSIADQAIQDMADNANKMGTSMESIQNAYQGFAKQNYTMLDNLKLGYGGTKSEMERLLKDAQKISGVKYNINNLTDVYEAIHVIQGELGITGTTAEEATKTIQGSMSAFQASWQNVLTALADENQNLDGVFEQFFIAVDNLWSNLEPRITVVISKLGDFLTKAINKAVPMVMTSIIPMITNNLPAIVEAVHAGIQAIVAVLPEITNAIAGLLPIIIDNLANGLPDILEMGIDVVLSLIDGILNALPQLIAKVPTIIRSIITTLVAKLPDILKTGARIIVSLIEGLLSLSAELGIGIGKIFSTIWDGLKGLTSKLWQLGKDMINGLINGVKSMLHSAVDAVKNVGSSMVSGIKNLLGIHSPSTVFRDEVGKNLALGIEEGFTDEMNSVAKDMQNAIPTNFNLNGQAMANGMTPNASAIVVNMNIYESENPQATANAVVNRLNAQIASEGMVWR